VGVTVKQEDFTFVAGNDPTVTLTIKADDVAVDLTGATVEVYVKDDVHKSDVDASTKKLSSTVPAEITISNQTTNKGELKVFFTSTHIGGNAPKHYRLDVIASARRQTYGYGRLYKINL